MRGEEDEIIKIQSHMNNERFLKSLQRINSFLIFVIDTRNYYNFTKPGSQAFNTYQNMSQRTETSWNLNFLLHRCKPG